jgi:predicted metalloenzyme YecM
MNLDYNIFLDKLNEEVKKLGIDISQFKLDHIAYQTKSSEEYDLLKKEFEKMADLVREPIVGERRVGVFKFKTPPVYKDQPIAAIELIEPRNGQSCQSGLEHAEYIPSVSLEKLLEKYPEVNWNVDNINRAEFPMLILRLSENMQVKFPRNSVLSPK